MSPLKSTESLGYRRARLRCRFCPRQWGRRVGETQPGMAVPQVLRATEAECHGCWESLRSSVLGVASTQVTKFLQGGTIFLLAGGLSSGVRLDPPSRPPTGARVLAQTKRSQFALWSRWSETVLWGSQTVFWQNFCLKLGAVKIH